MQFFHYDTIDSTNEQARRLLAHHAIDDAACIIARAQSAGRGTRGRTWASPRDAGLYLTLVERRPAHAPLRVTTLYTVAAGIACAEAIRELTGLPIQVKPINDLYCGSAKLGGLLCESVITREGMTVLLIGIGINLRQAARTAPDGEPLAATDLEELQGSFRRLPSPEALVEAIVPAVRRRVQQVHANAREDLEAVWEELATGNQPFPVEVSSPGRRALDSRVRPADSA